MKKIGIFILAIQLILCFSKTQGQDTLSIDQVKPLSYSFIIEDNEASGAGAAFLNSELADAQFTILGDYSDSKQISNFTRAILPALDQLGYKTMAVDVGPVSTQILRQLPKCQKDVTIAIGTLNKRYGFKEGSRFHVPMPALAGKEEAINIAYTLDQNWNLIGLNNDSWNALHMLLDELYFNLSEEGKQKYEAHYEKANMDLEQLYHERNGDLSSFARKFKNSSSIQAFLKIASTNKNNTLIIESIKYSLRKSEQYANKEYYAKNRDRIPYEKQILRKQLEDIDFDLKKDKLLVKAYRRHASRGFQPDGFYGFANTLHEFASYNGNKSLHIGFFKRYYIEDDQVKDEMDKDYYVRNRYRDVIQMGQKDEWTIIDLRPLIEGSYYSSEFTLSPWMQDLMKQYDLIVIPPTDSSLTPNHDFSQE